MWTLSTSSLLTRHMTQPNGNTSHYDTHQCPKHNTPAAHTVVDHCLQQATWENTHHPHPHCPTLCHSQEEASLIGEHTERVCAAPVCVDCARFTGGGVRTAEKSKNMQTHTHICTYMQPHPLHGVPTSIPMHG